MTSLILTTGLGAIGILISTLGAACLACALGFGLLCLYEAVSWVGRKHPVGVIVLAWAALSVCYWCGRWGLRVWGK
jgi:hypothetical protein